MEVYLEMTYFINALMILLSFELLCYLLNIQMTYKQIIKYVFTYNISLLCLCIDFFDDFLLIYYLFLTFFYYRKMTYIYYPVFLFIYISLLSFLSVIVPNAFIFQGVLVIEGLSLSSFWIIGIIGIVIIYCYMMFCNHKIQNQFVDVEYDHQLIKGLMDTGNQTSYKGYPVIFIVKDKIKNYQIIDQLIIETALNQESIDITIIDELMINGCVLHHVYVGVLLSCEYDCILNPQLLGGLI